VSNILEMGIRHRCNPDNNWKIVSLKGDILGLRYLGHKDIYQTYVSDKLYHTTFSLILKNEDWEFYYTGKEDE